MKTKHRMLLEMLILFVGLSGAMYSFIHFKYDSAAQLLAAFLGCMYYVSWGIIHHALQERINRALILEYTLVGGVAFLLILLTVTA